MKRLTLILTLCLYTYFLVAQEKWDFGIHIGYGERTSDITVDNYSKVGYTGGFHTIFNINRSIALVGELNLTHQRFSVDSPYESTWSWNEVLYKTESEAKIFQITYAQPSILFRYSVGNRKNIFFETGLIYQYIISDDNRQILTTTNFAERGIFGYIEEIYDEPIVTVEESSMYWRHRDFLLASLGIGFRIPIRKNKSSLLLKLRTNLGIAGGHYPFGSNTTYEGLIGFQF